MKIKRLLLKLRTKMTPGWELLITILFGWTGVRYVIRGNYFLALRMFLTFGVFGIGWLFDILTCVSQYMKYTKILTQGYEIKDSNYNGDKLKNCYWYTEGYGWLDDIGNVKIRDTSNRVTVYNEELPECITDEIWRRRLYICKNGIVCTNLEGIDFELKYKQVANIDIYRDGLVINGYVVRTMDSTEEARNVINKMITEEEN